MAKKKRKEKVRTVYVKPSEEEIQLAVGEGAPMMEEMRSWMGCSQFTLSCLTLPATVEELIKYTKDLQTECVPVWFEGNKKMSDFMQSYLSDVEGLLKMVLELKLVQRK